MQCGTASFLLLFLFLFSFSSSAANAFHFDSGYLCSGHHVEVAEIMDVKRARSFSFSYRFINQLVVTPNIGFF